MEIVWTESAKESAADIMAFVSKCWGNSMATAVWTRILKDVSLLERYPEIGQVYSIYKFKSQDVIIRELVVSKKNKIYYYINNDHLFIILLWDTRCNPKTLRKNLKSFLKKRI